MFNSIKIPTDLPGNWNVVMSRKCAQNGLYITFKQWLSANKLSLNLLKTEYLLIGSRHNINNISAVSNVSVDVPIKRLKETKALGVCVDQFLSWD